MSLQLTLASQEVVYSASILGAGAITIPEPIRVEGCFFQNSSGAVRTITFFTSIFATVNVFTMRVGVNGNNLFVPLPFEWHEGIILTASGAGVAGTVFYTPIV